MVWKSLLPYRVEFEVTTTRVERPHLLEADAVGELSGVGRWRLFEQDGVTAVLYEWNVATSKAWMNLVAPGRPPGLRVEPRLGDGPRRRGNRQSARLQAARQRLRRPSRYLSGAGTLQCQSAKASQTEFRPLLTQTEVIRMKLKPLGDRLIVKPIDEEETTASGIVLPDTAKEKPQKGKVVAAGDGAIKEDGSRRPLDVSEGDEVLYSKYGGTEVTVEGDDLLVMRESDILAKLG